MSRPLIVTTATGLVTCLGWWANCSVDGTSVTLTAALVEAEEGEGLVVAELRTEAEAKAFFRTLSERILLKAHVFDARDWPGPARHQVTDNSAGGG